MTNEPPLCPFEFMTAPENEGGIVHHTCKLWRNHRSCKKVPTRHICHCGEKMEADC